MVKAMRSSMLTQFAKGSSYLLVIAVLSLKLQCCDSSNIWTEITVPPYIPCTLPRCDALCEDIETQQGQICPRAASSNVKILGVMPGPDACQVELRNWISGPKVSAADPDGCGPCLLAEEKARCDVNSGSGRGYNAGGPPARSGHTMVRYTTPLRSTYVGATVLIIFGGIDRDDHFLNDVWWFCVDNCPEVQ
eukprot:3125420-Rhodomonas_salina.4